MQQVLAGIRRQHGTAPRRRARPLELDPLVQLVEAIDPSTLAGLRSRSLLLLGFGGALRRSELVALDVEDLDFDPGRGLLVTVRKSKTDQEQAGARVAVPYARDPRRCAVRALRRWLETAELHRGPVFRRMQPGGAGPALDDERDGLVAEPAVADSVAAAAPARPPGNQEGAARRMTQIIGSRGAGSTLGTALMSSGWPRSASRRGTGVADMSSTNVAGRSARASCGSVAARFRPERH